MSLSLINFGHINSNFLITYTCVCVCVYPNSYRTIFTVNQKSIKIDLYLSVKLTNRRFQTKRPGIPAEFHYRSPLTEMQLNISWPVSTPRGLFVQHRQ